MIGVEAASEVAPRAANAAAVSTHLVSMRSTSCRGFSATAPRLLGVRRHNRGQHVGHSLDTLEVRVTDAVVVVERQRLEPPVLRGNQGNWSAGVLRLLDGILQDVGGKLLVIDRENVHSGRKPGAPRRRAVAHV